MSSTTPSHRSGGRHRAPRTTLTDRVSETLAHAAPAVAPVLGASAVGAATVLTGGVASAAPGGTSHPTVQPRSHTYAPPLDRELAALRGCESSGRYSTNTGNGFYGAYQFDIGTWRGLGLSGLPSSAEPDLQDAAASALEQDRGWEPWPACSAHLGLVPRRAHAIAATEVVDGFAPAKGKHHAPTVTKSAHRTVADAAKHRAVAPPFAGTVLTTRFASTYRSDVRLWQERMAERGWPITVDGYFGPQTQHVALAFAQEKGLPVALLGEIDHAVWAAAWTSPIT
ncbi:MAG TPA: transglycosylase family protein [Mycobacteriales bacterium]|nr:transglycosylase family protein [Mycobacteriales bacterium]